MQSLRVFLKRLALFSFVMLPSMLFNLSLFVVDVNSLSETQQFIFLILSTLSYFINYAVYLKLKKYISLYYQLI